MSLYRIQNALYNKPWMIKPSFHRAMVKAFESYLKLNGQIPEGLSESEDNLTLDTMMQITTPSIAVIPVDGVIGKHLSLMEMECSGATDIDQIAMAMKIARDDNSIESILLTFNTPGGTVTGVKEFGNLIDAIDKVKPVYGYTDTMCASAGYWLASQCRAFFVTPSSDIGSIGVYSLLVDESRAIEDAGVKVNAISAGKWKLAGASFKPLTDEERAMFQADVDKIYSDFKETVLQKRNVSDEVMQGQCFNGEDAVKHDLADCVVSSMDEVLELITGRTN